MRTLQGQPTYHEDVKKSRFYAVAARVDSVDEALSFIDAASDAQAGHNCWAYRVGSEYRFSDDGEPGGSAGRPILSAIEGQDLDHVCVVVSRIFGGIKLGVGGLVRAYGGAAAKCLQDAAVIRVEPEQALRISVPFANTSEVYVLLERFGGEKKDEMFDADGVTLDVVVSEGQVQEFLEQLADRTAGSAVVEIEE